jgi:hypothetical protein
MPAKLEEIGAVRRELWSLLQLQIDSLGSTQELSDRQIIECYNRQIRVLELREKLETYNADRLEFDLTLDTGNNPSPRAPQDNVDSLLHAA